MSNIVFNGGEWALWPVLFIGYFVLDFLGTKNVIIIQQLKVVPNAFISMFTTILATVGSYVCVKDSLWNLAPISLGVWFGSYFALKWEIEIRRKGMAKNLNNVKNPTKRVKHRGIHAKTKQSNNKGSKNYVKPRVGQGKKR